ncbi:MAG TPA: zinc ribbon domain-containing protein [Candidatus Omnitrophota bacterium]|nr:zinc ribbon domain-containing protein [Candidatus Omnitrophota bacterium]HPT39825.1 zinc ribbon domain-containing protein [Candidatus Omnitrophota bacterium]
MNKSESLVNDLGMRIVKLCIILGVMFLFRFLISKVTVFDETRFFRTGLTVLDILIGAANAVILVFLMQFGLYLDKHYELVNFPKAMAIFKWIVILSTSIIAYQIFYHMAKHIFRRHDIEYYNITFLCVSLLILVRLGVLIFTNMEKITDVFVGKIKIVLREPTGDDSAAEAMTPKCPGCGKEIETGMAFCPKCGVKIA